MKVLLVSGVWMLKWRFLDWLFQCMVRCQLSAEAVRLLVVLGRVFRVFVFSVCEVVERRAA